eukprot:scaffold80721_cov33-Tisochrysis_lutea.AAC.3
MVMVKARPPPNGSSTCNEYSSSQYSAHAIAYGFRPMETNLKEHAFMNKIDSRHSLPAVLVVVLLAIAIAPTCPRR